MGFLTRITDQRWNLLLKTWLTDSLLHSKQANYIALLKSCCPNQGLGNFAEEKSENNSLRQGCEMLYSGHDLTKNTAQSWLLSQELHEIEQLKFLVEKM